MTAVMEQSAPHTNGLVIRWAARYDLLAWLFTRGRERELRERIISLAGLDRGAAVLDIGCGTGTLAIAATRHVGPSGTVHGIDASPPMIARATRKAEKAGVNAVFQICVCGPGGWLDDEPGNGGGGEESNPERPKWLRERSDDRRHGGRR